MRLVSSVRFNAPSARAGLILSHGLKGASHPHKCGVAGLGKARTPDEYTAWGGGLGGEEFYADAARVRGPDVGRAWQDLHGYRGDTQPKFWEHQDASGRHA